MNKAAFAHFAASADSLRRKMAIPGSMPPYPIPPGTKDPCMGTA